MAVDYVVCLTPSDLPALSLLAQSLKKHVGKARYQIHALIIMPENQQLIAKLTDLGKKKSRKEKSQQAKRQLHRQAWFEKCQFYKLSDIVSPGQLFWLYQRVTPAELSLALQAKLAAKVAATSACLTILSVNSIVSGKLSDYLAKQNTNLETSFAIELYAKNSTLDLNPDQLVDSYFIPDCATLHHAIDPSAQDYQLAAHPGFITPSHTLAASLLGSKITDIGKFYQSYLTAAWLGQLPKFWTQALANFPQVKVDHNLSVARAWEFNNSAGQQRECQLITASQQHFSDFRPQWPSSFWLTWLDQYQSDYQKIERELQALISETVQDTTANNSLTVNNYDFLNSGQLKPLIISVLSQYYPDTALSFDQSVPATREEIYAILATPRKIHANLPLLLPLAWHCYQLRADLQEHIPLGSNDFVSKLYDWIDNYGIYEMGIREEWQYIQKQRQSGFIDKITSLFPPVRKLADHLVKNPVDKQSKVSGQADKLLHADTFAPLTQTTHNPADVKDLHNLQQALNGNFSQEILAQAKTQARPGAVALIYQVRQDWQERYPFGLTKLQAKQLVNFLWQRSIVDQLPLTLHQLTLFLADLGSDWTADLIRNYQYSPVLQARFPLALTPIEDIHFIDAARQYETPDCQIPSVTTLWTSVPMATQLTCLCREIPRQKQSASRDVDESVALAEILSEIPLAEILKTIDQYYPQLPADWHRQAVHYVNQMTQQDSKYSLPGRVEVVGFLASPLGLGVMGRGIVQALESANIETGAVPLGVKHSCGMDCPTSVPQQLTSTVIISVNDDCLHLAFEQYGRENLRGKRVIAAMTWEKTDYYPVHAWEQYVDEVWACSNFAAAAIGQKLTVPVLSMPIAVTVSDNPPSQRQRFACDENDFVIVFAMDANSRWQRKNPQALLEMLRLVLSKRPELVDKLKLIIHIRDAISAPDDMAKLRQSGDGLPVIFSTQELTNQEIHGLIADCDAYVSLHRSEGFGLTMAEAMAYGKPVIATGYGGNLEFMDMSNSLLVRFVDHLVASPDPNSADAVLETKPKVDSGVINDILYGQLGVEVDINHAAEALLTLIDNPEFAKKLGIQAKFTVQTKLSPQHIGQLMRERLNLLARNTKKAK